MNHGALATLPKARLLRDAAQAVRRLADSTGARYRNALFNQEPGLTEGLLILASRARCR
jgi:hypothetical protein